MQEILGAGIREARQRKGWRQEEAAHWFRFYGLKTWRTGTVGQMEAGLRKSSIEELLLMCIALEVTPADLLPNTDEQIEFSGGAAMTARAARALLSSDWDNFVEMPPSDLYFPGEEVVDEVAEQDRAEHARLNALLKPILDKHPVAQGDVWKDALRRPTDMERYAANKLGVETAVIKTAARILWGHDLEQERDARVGDVTTLPPRSIQGRRGHATRNLLDELREFLETVYGPELA